MNKFIFLLAISSSTFARAYDFSCKQAQIFILNIGADTLKKLSVEEQKISELGSFLQSKPSLNGPMISTASYISSSEPYEQLWCKLKSQDAVVRELRVSAESPAKPCSSLQEHIFSLAIDSLIEDVSKRPSLSDLKISILEDQDSTGGFDWAPSQVKFELKDNITGIRAMRLKTPLWIPRFGGMNYCKVLSLEGAKAFLRTRLEP